MTEPSVSVIVAVRNGERFLAEAIDSILAQTLAPLEIVVIDGASTDRTEEIATSYPQVRHHRQTGLGIPGAYNQGLELVQGDLVAWLSHDDTWEPRKLELQVEALLDNPDWQYVVCRRRYFLEDGCEIPSGFRRELLDEPPVAFCMETLLARVGVFDQVGVFDTAYGVAEDVDWFSRARDLSVPCGVVNEALLNRRVHDRNSSLTDTSNNDNLLHLLRRSIDRKRSADPDDHE